MALERRPLGARSTFQGLSSSLSSTAAIRKRISLEVWRAIVRSTLNARAQLPNHIQRTVKVYSTREIIIHQKGPFFTILLSSMKSGRRAPWLGAWFTTAQRNDGGWSCLSRWVRSASTFQGLSTASFHRQQRCWKQCVLCEGMDANGTNLCLITPSCIHRGWKSGFSLIMSFSAETGWNWLTL